jgi:hypothetical protein
MTDSLRSRFRLAHWGWFLLMTVVLVIAGIGSSIWLPWCREQRVIQLIEGWGGTVKTETGDPEWLRNLVGEDRIKQGRLFERVVEVSLNGTAVSDTELRYLSRLIHLRKLLLAKTAVTDAGLIHLGRLTELRVLCLNRTAVTDAGLDYLNRLPNIKSLYLKGTAVTGSSFVTTSGFADLELLILSETNVTDAGLAGLSRLTNLRFLQLEDQLEDAAITANGMKELKRALPNCNIRRWRITFHGPSPPFRRGPI